MKLVLCLKCTEIFSLNYDRRTCHCGKSWGKYNTDQDGVYGGLAVPLGIANESLIEAVREFSAGNVKEPGGKRFEAFVIPIDCPTFTRDSKR